jgi:hypothetical protein
MKNTKQSSKLWQVFEKKHGIHASSYSPSELVSIIKQHDLVPEKHEIHEFINQIARFYGNRGGLFSCPAVISNSITKILDSRSASTILDPWAGLGSLLAIAQQATSAARSIGYCSNNDEGELAQTIFPDSEWFVGSSLDLLAHLDSPIDVIVSMLPFNATSNQSLKLEDLSGNQVPIKSSLDNLILATSTSRLDVNGIGLYIVSPSFFHSPRSVFKYFPQLGFYVEAALSLPPGAFAPYTFISTYLLVVRRRPKNKMFVAQLSHDLNTNTQVLDNYLRETEGKTVDLGRYVEPYEFRGLESLRAQEFFESASQQFGYPSVSLANLAADIKLGRSKDEFKFLPVQNALYIPIIGKSDVVSSLDDLSLKIHNYAQVAVDASKSDATFIAQFLNSELGVKIRESRMMGVHIPKLNKQALGSLEIFVPDLVTQQTMLGIEARLASEENTLLSLHNDLLELRRELWRSPRSSESVSSRLLRFSERISGDLKEEARLRLDQWFETIPFPIASILRAWQATPSDDYKIKHEHLLHFFEATAQFIGIIFLSAYSSNETLYASHKDKLNEAFAKQNLSFQRATFGTWKLVVEYFGKQTRLLLQENSNRQDKAGIGENMCASIFSDSTLRLPRLLSNKEIVNILSVTNKMRNDWSGHGGVVGQEEARLRNEQLLGQVEKLRQAMTDIWDSAVVVNALHCKPRRGIFENEIAILRGSNSEFLKESREMSTWLDVDSLYIINRQQSGALKLLPLIQVSASPGTAKNACYFFNRTDRESVRFISYHFAGKPELSGQFQEATEAIRFLSES